MGLTTVAIEIKNPYKIKQIRQVSFFVDTGALYSIVPASLLEDIGISRRRQQKFILANGEVITRWVGEAMFKYEDREGTAPVIFGEEADKTVLGVVTLETLGLEVDPINRKLKPAPGLLI